MVSITTRGTWLPPGPSRYARFNPWGARASAGKSLRQAAKRVFIDCATNAILPVPDRLDCIARFALPLRAPAPESLLGMHIPHPRVGPARHERQADEVPPSADSARR